MGWVGMKFVCLICRCRRQRRRRIRAAIVTIVVLVVIVVVYLVVVNVVVITLVVVVVVVKPFIRSNKSFFFLSHPPPSPFPPFSLHHAHLHLFVRMYIYIYIYVISSYCFCVFFVLLSVIVLVFCPLSLPFRRRRRLSGEEKERIETEKRLKNLRIVRKTDRETDEIKGSLHPSIDPYLNRNLHFDYGSRFVNSLRHPWVNESVNLFFEMAGARGTKPLFSSAEENARTAREIVQSQLVSTAVAANAQKNKNLVASLRTAMVGAGLDTDRVETTLSTFDPTVTIGEYDARNKNGHLVKVS